jgi:virulence factor Mce-like protein
VSPLLQRNPQRGGARRRRLSPVSIGVLAAGFILLFAIGTFRKDIPFVHGTRIDIMFRTSNQLIKGSPVRIAGVEVGKVVQLTPGPEGTTQVVRVELKDNALPLHADATARIRPRLFLEGGFYIDLRAGSPSAKTLSDQDTIPVTQTSTPVQFNQILSELTTPIRQSLRTTVREFDTALQGGGAEGFGRVSKPLAPLLRDTAQISEASRGIAPHDLSTFISTSARTSKGIAQSREQLASLVTALNRTMGALSANDTALAASIRELDGVMQVAPGALTALDRSLPSVNRTVRDLRPSLPVLPGVLRDGAKLLVQLRLASRPSELPRLLANLKPTLARLPKLEAQLSTLFPLVTPVTDCLRQNALPILTAKVPDGNLSTGYPVYLDVAHAFVGLAGAAGNFDGNGPAVRYQAGVGPSAVAIGGLPNLETLYGSAAQPIIGSNPQWLGRGVIPPKRPDQTCRDQAVPNLNNRNSAVSASVRNQTGFENAGKASTTRAKLGIDQIRALLGRLKATSAGAGR